PISTTTESICASIWEYGTAWPLAWTLNVIVRPRLLVGSIYPDRLFTRSMLPVLAITRPSRDVPTKRLSNEPGWPAWGSPATNAPPFGWLCMYPSSLANACGVTRLPAARPEPSSSANAVESMCTESIRKRRSTSSPASHEPSPLSSRPNSLSSISANQLWLELRMGKMMSGSGRPRKAASGEAQPRSVRYASEWVVLAHRRARVRRDRAGPVLERDQPQVGRPGDRRRCVHNGPRLDAKVHAVVVKAEARHGGGVPPREVPGVPAVVDESRLEIGAVA